MCVLGSDTDMRGLCLLPWFEVGVLSSAHPHQSRSKGLCAPMIVREGA